MKGWSLNVRCLKALTVVLVLSAVTAPATAQFYKWVDENGKVHFSDQPPRKKPAEKLELKGIPKTGNQDAPSEAQRRERQQQLLKSMEKDRKAIEQQRAKERQDKKDKAALCQRLKKKKRYGQPIFIPWIKMANIFTTTKKLQKPSAKPRWMPTIKTASES